MDKSYQKDIEVLKKRHERGNWLVLIQTPLETELPWQIIQEIRNLFLFSLAFLYSTIPAAKYL